MGSFITATIAAAFLGLLAFIVFIVLRRMAERRAFKEEELSQLRAELNSVVVSDPEPIDDRPSAVVHQFSVRPREPSLNSSDTKKGSSPIAELDEWRNRPKPPQQRFRRP
jgi:hypothetical protein